MEGLKGFVANQNASAPFESDELLRRVASGNAVLFIGAGFSAGVSAVSSEELPTAKILADKLGSLAGFDADGDLRYAAARFKRDRGADELVDYLRDALAISKPDHSHEVIAGLQWRRVYTTNYDLLFERAAEASNRVVSTVDLADPPSEYLNRGNACVHINGSLKNLSVEALDGPFKLTNHSYLAPDALSSSQWSYAFKRDLEAASCIVFVGYSLYDIEIQRVLFGSPHFFDKTYFVCHPKESDKNVYVLSEFGAVLPFGVSWFSSLIDGSRSKFQDEFLGDRPRMLERYELSRSDKPIRDAEVSTMLLHGDIDDSLIDSSMASDLGAPLLIIRDEVHASLKALESGKNVVLAGDFGNGKTIASRMIKSRLTSQGYDVYVAGEFDSAQHSDLELLAKRDKLSFIVIDGFELNMGLIEHYCLLAPKNIRLLLCARTSAVERVRKQLRDWGLDFIEMPVDELSKPEISRLIDIFDNVGLWGGLASLSASEKANRIYHKNRSQISLSLLEILDAPQVKARVAGLLKSLLADPTQKATVFAIAVLEILDAPTNISLVSEIAGNNAIYEPKLRLNEDFQSIFKLHGSSVKTKSSLFALSIVRGHFTAPYVVDELLKVVDKFNAERNYAIEKNHIFKSLLKFSVVERMLPGASLEQKKANLAKYYEELKRRVSWLKTDPHFWLQYSMAQINFGDYGPAQKYLDQAYALARSRQNYHTEQFDTQQARMWLEMSAKSEDSKESYRLFAAAHDLLKRVASDLHKYWQYARYAEVYEKQYAGYTRGSAASFEQSVKNAVSEMNISLNKGGLSGVDTIPTRRITERLEKVVEAIKSSRVGSP